MSVLTQSVVAYKLDAWGSMFIPVFLFFILIGILLIIKSFELRRPQRVVMIRNAEARLMRAVGVLLIVVSLLVFGRMMNLF
jgi:hypothetical protein